MTSEGGFVPADAERIASGFSLKPMAIMSDMGTTKVFNANQTAILFENLQNKRPYNRGENTV